MGAGAREPEGAREKGEGRERDTVRHNCSVVHPARLPLCWVLKLLLTVPAAHGCSREGVWGS